MTRLTIEFGCLQRDRESFYAQIHAPEPRPPSTREVYCHLCRYGRVLHVQPAGLFFFGAPASSFVAFFAGGIEECCETYRNAHRGLHGKATWTGEELVTRLVSVSSHEAQRLGREALLGPAARQRTGAEVELLAKPKGRKPQRVVCVVGAASRARLALKALEERLACLRAAREEGPPAMDDEAIFPPLRAAA